MNIPSSHASQPSQIASAQSMVRTTASDYKARLQANEDDSRSKPTFAEERKADNEAFIRSRGKSIGVHLNASA